LRRKIVVGLALLTVGAALLILSGAEIYRAMSSATHGLALKHLAVLALGLASVSIGAEHLGLDLLGSQETQRGEVAHSRWATAEDLVVHNIADGP
jgi:hypothetical protein